MKKIILFDVDGTITESGQIIKNDMTILLNNLQNNGYEIGIVGGGKLDKILIQMDNKIHFDHYFSECGCVYNSVKETKSYVAELDAGRANAMKESNNKNLETIYIKNIREHKLYSKINILIKTALDFLSKVDYLLTGNFIDLRNGIIYIYAQWDGYCVDTYNTQHCESYQEDIHCCYLVRLFVCSFVRLLIY